MDDPCGHPLLLLVPEQATYQTEKALAERCPGKGFSRAQVVSFRRLALRILEEAGGASRPAVSEVGRLIALRAALESCRHKLLFFRGASAQTGFCQAIAATLSEFKSSCTSTQMLADTIPSIKDGVLSRKLHDLLVIWQSLTQCISDRNSDPDDYLTLAAERAASTALIHKAEIWVDGFAGFTAQEYAMLRALLLSARHLSLALCIAPEALDTIADECGTFYPTHVTCTRLLSIASGEGVAVTMNPLHGVKRFAAQASLTHLESALINRPYRPFPAPPEGINLVAASNRRSEVEGAAREILSLARDRGYRFREISVVVRNLDDYSDLVAPIFQAHGIPFFIDRKRTVAHHPLVELIASALEISTSGWRYETVFRYLKTDLIPLRRDEVDLLENYVLANGIREHEWGSIDPWPYPPSRQGWDLAREAAHARFVAMVDDLRRRASRHLLAFVETVTKSQNTAERAQAVFVLLHELDVRHSLNTWSEECFSAGDLDGYREHGQIWDAVVHILDQVALTLGETSLELEEFCRVVTEALDGIRLGMIPHGVDQVLIASLDRSRNPEIKAAFVLGVNDGILPCRHTDNGLHSETERETLLQSGLPMAPSARQRAFEEQYLAYIALTRAAEYLWVSYAMSDTEGRAMHPSRLINDLRTIFPSLTERILTTDAGSQDITMVTSPRPTVACLLGELRASVASDREPSPLWHIVSEWFRESPEWGTYFARCSASLTYTNHETKITPATARRLYAQPIALSVSQVEKFQGCHFAHFAAHGLRLRERARLKVAAPELGDFLHEALKIAGETVQSAGREWHDLSPDDVAALARETIGRLVPEFMNEVLHSTARLQYLTKRLQRVLERALGVLVEHCRRGAFIPVAFEIGFGPGERLPGLSYAIGEGAEILLRGRIDRIDWAVTPGGKYVRIIDYKTGRAQPDRTLVSHGLQLQLLTYMLVVLANAESLFGEPVRPAGVFYFGVRDPLVKTDRPLDSAATAKKILSELKLKGFVISDPETIALMDRKAGGPSDVLPVRVRRDGSYQPSDTLVTAEEFSELCAHVEDTFVAAGQQILGGSVTIAPSRVGMFDACRYCSYRPVCHFDTLMPGNGYRRL